jgi:hypothetical protein
MENNKTISITGTNTRYKLKKSQGIVAENGIRTASMFWDISDQDMTHDIQKNIIHQLIMTSTNNNEINEFAENNSALRTIMKEQIKKKLASYRRQDSIHDSRKIISALSEQHTYELLDKSELLCHYCSMPIMVVYRNVRYEYQWSLDRIDNTRGHDLENVVISCLKCNLARRNIRQELFENTKKFTVSKQNIN